MRHRQVFPICVIILFFLFSVTADGEEKSPMKITSSAFKEGEMIPVLYSCKGQDISPPLQWDGIPSTTKSLVLISDDPDAPMGTWVHWVYFNIPQAVRILPVNMEKGPSSSLGGIQGKNSWGRNGYGGPCPPSGTHRYFFTVYALDILLDLKADAQKDDVLKAADGHILAKCSLMGRFKK